MAIVPSSERPCSTGRTCSGSLCVGWNDLHVADAGQQRFLEIIAERAATALSARALTDRLDEQVVVAEALAAELERRTRNLRSGKRRSGFCKS